MVATAMARSGGEVVAARPTLLIVEDHTRFAESVLAEPFRDCWVVHLAADVQQAFSILADVCVLDLALVDLTLPDGRTLDAPRHGSGFKVVRQVRRRFPRARAVVVTGHLESELVNSATAHGAHYLHKGGNLSGVLSRLAESMAFADGRAAHAPFEFASELSGRHGLSRRETEVVALALQGFSNREVAEQLGTSENTVKCQVRSVLDKCEADRIATLRESYRCRCCPRR
jgi:DNA-binding NarL/FixJ family response regulator